MRPEDLRLLQAIHRRGSLRKAAAQLRISQPSATHALRQLERHLGAQLVYRGPEGSALTEVGTAVLPLAETLLLTEQRLYDEVQALLSLDRGRLRLGASGPSTTGLLIPVLHKLTADHPGLDVQIIEAGSVEITEHVAAGNLDVGVVRRAEVLGAPTESVVVQDVQCTRLVVCVPGSHDWLPAARPVRLVDLRSESLVLPRVGYLAREIVRRTLGEGQVRIVCRTEHPAAARAFVAQGFGVTVATEEEAQRDGHWGAFGVVPVHENEATVWTSVVRQNTPYTATVARRFLVMLAEHLAADSSR